MEKCKIKGSEYIKKHTKPKINIYNNIYLKSMFLCILTLIYLILRLTQKAFDEDERKSKVIERPKKTHLKKETKFEYFCCFCAMGKKENLYSRELIEYYRSIGIEKFVFGDNNEPNTEKLSDVLQDYIKNGVVDILEIFGSTIGQGEFYGVMYEKYKKRCKWLTFFDFDEYLVMHFDNTKNLTIKEYLSSDIFHDCEGIEINWLMHGDNDLVYYDNRSSIERFTRPDYSNYANRFVKSIVRGNLDKIVFKPGDTQHQPNRELKLCNSLGEPAEYYPDCIIPPIFKYSYIMHFNTRTAEEYANKIKRGYPSGFSFKSNELNQRVRNFFKNNKFTEEKLEVFKKSFNVTIDYADNKS